MAPCQGQYLKLVVWIGRERWIVRTMQAFICCNSLWHRWTCISMRTIPQPLALTKTPNLTLIKKNSLSPQIPSWSCNYQWKCTHWPKIPVLHIVKSWLHIVKSGNKYSRLHYVAWTVYKTHSVRAGICCLDMRVSIKQTYFK